ncbi:MAG: multidrug transporter [Rickettsia endosymbiont of Haemaphysalis japonica]
MLLFHEIATQPTAAHNADLVSTQQSQLEKDQDILYNL